MYKKTNYKYSLNFLEIENLHKIISPNTYYRLTYMINKAIRYELKLYGVNYLWSYIRVSMEEYYANNIPMGRY